MSENNDSHDDGHHINYRGIYFALLILFLISVAGPEVGERLGLPWITLVTAFGIALVKARLVINNFMHLAWEKRIMKWVLATSVILMFLMVAGVAPDVMNHEGNNWENLAAKEAVQRGLAEAAGYPDGEGEAEGEAELVVAAAGFSAATSYGQICATCHGAGGAGDGIAGAALDPAPANFTDPAFWNDPIRTDNLRERVLTVIRDGGPAIGVSALMAPWGALYTDDQLEEMVDFVMSFRPDE